MPSNLNLDYYYGTEAEQYSFYRIPKTLLTDPHYKKVSIEAKVLYGLLLDRMGLSVRNGWMDSERRIYIYFTQEDTMALMSCGKDKATKLFRELDQGGIGLIERKKQGQGRPTRIYVKNFTLPPEPGQTLPSPEPTPPSTPIQTAEKPQCRPLDSAAVKTADIAQSAPLEMRGQDSGFSVPNKTEGIQTDLNQPDSSISPSIPLELVRGRLLKLDGEHIRYVMESLRQNTTQVVNIRAYTLAALYNAPTTISQYYTAQVSHDMVQGFRGG